MREPGPRLGRGLAALLGEVKPADPADHATAATKLDLLEPGPFQPRGKIKEGDLDELAASIRAQGVLQPLLIRPHPLRQGRFQIIAGERRWRAAQQAGLDAVPCFVRDLSDADASAAALVENLQRQDLNPIEEAQGFRRLIDDFGLTQEELGTAIGKSRSHVANLLRLLNLPPEVIGFVRDGVLSAGHARAALACPDPLVAAEMMIARGMSVRQAEALVHREAAATEKPPRKQHALEEGTADLRAVEADLAEQLGLQVSISYNGRGGTISLRYQSLDQLDYILAKLGKAAN